MPKKKRSSFQYESSATHEMKIEYLRIPSFDDSNNCKQSAGIAFSGDQNRCKDA